MMVINPLRVVCFCVSDMVSSDLILRLRSSKLFIGMRRLGIHTGFDARTLLYPIQGVAYAKDASGAVPRGYRA